MTDTSQEQPPLSPAELAYMRLWAAMPDKPSETGTAQLRALAMQLGVKP